jgi:transcriptional regulator with XRE-family HTH domain
VSDSFGILIKTRREQLGRTQRRIAQDARVAQSALSMLERGKLGPSPEQLEGLLDTLFPGDDPNRERVRGAALNFTGGGRRVAASTADHERMVAQITELLRYVDTPRLLRNYGAICELLGAHFS